MRKQVGKAVRERFTEQLQLRLPAFQPVVTNKVPSGWRLFEHHVASDLVLYLMLSIPPNHDGFTVEASWSRHGRFPSHLSLLSPRDNPRCGIRRDLPQDGDYRFRIPSLWLDRDFWWEVVPRKSWEETVVEQDEVAKTGVIPPEPPVDEAMGRITPLVDDAIAKIEQYVVPYFRGVAAELGRLDLMK